MASIHKKCGKWYIAYTDGNGDRHFVSSGILYSPPGKDAKDRRLKAKESKIRAQHMADKIELAAQGFRRNGVIQKIFARMIGEQRRSDAEQSGMTLQEYFDDWAQKKMNDLSASYGRQIRRCKTEFYASTNGRIDTHIVHIDEEDISNYVDRLKERKLSGTTINKRLHILSEMFRSAEKQGYVIVNPVIEDHLRDENPNEKQAFIPSQIELILGATKKVDWHTVTLFGFYCGMRLGDARSQTWDAIDFENRKITWVPIKTRRKRSRKAKIIVTPLHPVLYDHLIKVRAMCGTEPWVTPSLAKRPISNLSEEFVGLIRAAEIDPLEVPQPNGHTMCLLTNHSLRHGFATELKRVGAPEKEWSMLTGHSAPFRRWNGEPISLVARIYNHVNIEDLRKWINKLPALRFNSTGKNSNQ